MGSAGEKDGGGRLTEAEIIGRAARRFASRAEILETGIGDDAAVLSPLPGDKLRQLVTCDLLVEGVHFERRLLSMEDIGYKALAVSVSDIAAMGGRATFAFGSLGIPADATAAEVDALLDGVEQAVGEHDVLLAGGDTVAAPQWIIGFTVLGSLEGTPLLRGGARAGDTIWHSGQLGLSQVGLGLLWSGDADTSGAVERVAIAAHRRPAARQELGQYLQRTSAASACLDLSDSLAQCLLQLADAAGVGLEVDFRDYAVSPVVSEFCSRQPRWAAGSSAAFIQPARYDPAGREQHYHSLAEFLLASAEDYELLLTVPSAAEQLLAASPLPLVRLGVVTEAERGRRYLDERGGEHELRPVGFAHL